MRRGTRTLALAYRDLPAGADFEAKSASVLNVDCAEALAVETELTFVSLVGIEDPLRPEVPGAIKRCYEAGINVRLVTGDSPNTTVPIGCHTGVLKGWPQPDNSSRKWPRADWKTPDIAAYYLSYTIAILLLKVGSFVNAKSPLAAIPLLWVNILMDALASLALALEPPTENLLKRDPVNQSKNIITKIMWGNILARRHLYLAPVVTHTRGKIEYSPHFFFCVVTSSLRALTQRQRHGPHRYCHFEGVKKLGAGSGRAGGWILSRTSIVLRKKTRYVQSADS